MQTITINVPDELVIPIKKLVNSLVSDVKGEQKDYTIPKLEEVRKYISENNIRISPERFFNYYERRQWKAAGYTFDWKEKLKEWESNDVVDKTKNAPVSAPSKGVPLNVDDINNLTKMFKGGE